MYSCLHLFLFFIALHFFPVIVAHLFSFRHHFIILRVSYAILLRRFFPLLSFHLILSRYLWWYLLFYCVDNGDDYLIVVSYTGRPHVAESQAVKWSLYLSVVVVMKKFIWIECNERRRNGTVWSFISFVWGVRLWFSTLDAFVSLQLSQHWWTSFSHLFFSCFVSYTITLSKMKCQSFAITFTKLTQYTIIKLSELPFSVISFFFLLSCVFFVLVCFRL